MDSYGRISSVTIYDVLDHKVEKLISEGINEVAKYIKNYYYYDHNSSRLSDVKRNDRP